MRLARIAVVAVLGAALVIARPARAEINMADSVEWATADSDLVVVGTIASSTTRTVDHASWTIATIDIARTLKGPRGKRVQIAIAGDARALTPWQGKELLLFLVTSARRARGTDCTSGCHYDLAAYAPRRASNDDSVVVLDATAGDEVYTARFDALRAKADVLAAVRAASGSRATRAVRFDAPFDSPAGRALYGGSTVWIYLPADAATEQFALAQLAAPDVWARVDAVRALGAFRSPGNVRRLRALLGDATVAEQTDDTGRQRYYPVRAAAHQVLAAWGVRHTAPVVREPLPSTALPPPAP